MKKAIERLKWRMGNETFRPNKNDVEAINEIITFYNDFESRVFERQELFAKLYVYLFMKVLEQDKSTVFENEARRKIGNILEKPLCQIIEELQQSLNDSELYVMIDKTKTNGVIPEGMDHIHEDYIAEVLSNSGISPNEKAIKVMNWKKEKIKNQEAFNKLFKENPDAFTKGVWDYDKVEEEVMDEVNQMIKLYS
jgi:hypothetical protein